MRNFNTRKVKLIGCFNYWDDYYKEQERLMEAFKKNLELIKKLRKENGY